MSKNEIVRSAEQLQRAHDLLVTVLFDKQLQQELMGEDDPERRLSFEAINASASVLCWVLGHPNHNFAHNLIRLEARVVAAGYEPKIVDEDHGSLPS